MTTALPPEPTRSPSRADALNRDCFCRTLNRRQLRVQLEATPPLHGLTAQIQATRPHLFANHVVYVSKTVQAQIEALVAAIERVANLPGYQAQALGRAQAIAQRAWGPQSVCMGYDFHLSPAGPQLIEINTNAGGLLLNTALAQAQEACCTKPAPAVDGCNNAARLQGELFEMFASEWRLQRGAQPWRNVLIVDSAPQAQYLAPEFALFRQLFAQHGLKAGVTDPSELQWQGGQLLHHGTPVDLVYNRLTDFYLDNPAHLALRQAYEAGAVVLTPHPHAHALLADKRNLIALSQNTLLSAWGASAADRKLLGACVPMTRLVTPERADELWAQRRHLFFKPVASYGAKAAYRGDKLTRRVWAEILAGDFVTQTLVPPPERLIEVDGAPTDLKFDIRAFAYAGQVQLLAARMYSGQTTNFRTPGGGFAPVVVVPDPETD